MNAPISHSCKNQPQAETAHQVRAAYSTFHSIIQQIGQGRVMRKAYTRPLVLNKRMAAVKSYLYVKAVNDAIYKYHQPP